MSTDKFYRLEIHFEEDHVWATVPEFPGVFASGSDVRELAESLVEAINMYLGREEISFARIEGGDGRRPTPARLELVPC